MKRKKKDPYQDYVEHPRFGRGPRITGLNPNPLDDDVCLGSQSISTQELRLRFRDIDDEFILESLSNLREQASYRIANTAISANQSKHNQRSYSRRTHYFDLSLVCMDCRRPFVFFAAEQQYWFEDLGFDLSARCLRCIECRKRVQNSVQLKKGFDHLAQVKARTAAQNLAMAELCLTLMELGSFPATKTKQVRTLLNKAMKQTLEPDAASVDLERASLLRRVLAIEVSAKAALDPKSISQGDTPL